MNKFEVEAMSLLELKALHDQLEEEVKNRLNLKDASGHTKIRPSLLTYINEVERSHYDHVSFDPESTDVERVFLEDGFGRVIVKLNYYRETDGKWDRREYSVSLETIEDPLAAIEQHQKKKQEEADKSASYTRERRLKLFRELEAEFASEGEDTHESTL